MTLGEFILKTADGSLFGNLKVRNTSGWSLYSFFVRRGGEPGDYFVLVFDLQKRETTAYIGDADLLNDFLPEK